MEPKLVGTDSAGKFELVLDKNTVVVEKKETWDPDHEEIDFEIIMMADCACEAGGESKKDHVRLVITTDDKFIADKFQVGKNVDVKCTQTLLHKHNQKHGVM